MDEPQGLLHTTSFFRGFLVFIVDTVKGRNPENPEMRTQFRAQESSFQTEIFLPNPVDEMTKI